MFLIYMILYLEYKFFNNLNIKKITVYVFCMYIFKFVYFTRFDINFLCIFSINCIFLHV